jgi:DNA-binding response OmpR family regulator
MIRVAVITSDPGTRRGVMEELAMHSDAFDTFAVLPSDAAGQLLENRADVLLLDVQAVFQTDAQALTNAICQANPKGSFICCCSGCPTDRERITAIEDAGADWCPLPASGGELAGFIRKVYDRPHRDELAHASFLAALWDLVVEEEGRRGITRPPQIEIGYNSTRNGQVSWIGKLTETFVRIVRQRPRVSRV